MKKIVFSIFACGFAISSFAQNETTNTAEWQSLSLNESIALGLQNHQSMRLADNAVKKSEQDARDALSTYLPQVSLQSTLDYNYKLQQNVIPAGVFGPEEQRITFGNKYQSNTVIQLDQKIYDQASLTGIKASKPNTELAKLQVATTKEDLIYNISNAYYSALVAEQQMGLLEANVTRFNELKRITQLQKDNGVANTVDVEQVEVNLNNVLAQIEILKNQIALAKNTLKNYMNLPQSTLILLTDSAKIVNEAIDNQLEQSVTQFDFSKTIPYQQYKYQNELYDLNVKRMRQMIYPTLGFYARYGANGFGNDNLLGAWDPLLDFGSMGLKLTWGIFTGFKRDAAYQNAIISRDNSQINMELTQNNMALQFENAKTQMKSTQSTIATNKRNMEMAQRVYDVTNFRYKEGVANMTQLLNAELSVREAYSNYTRSLLDYYKAELDLQKANGTLLSNYLSQQ